MCCKIHSEKYCIQLCNLFYSDTYLRDRARRWESIPDTFVCCRWTVNNRAFPASQPAMLLNSPFRRDLKSSVATHYSQDQYLIIFLVHRHWPAVCSIFVRYPKKWLPLFLFCNCQENQFFD